MNRTVRRGLPAVALVVVLAYCATASAAGTVTVTKLPIADAGIVVGEHPARDADGGEAGTVTALVCGGVCAAHVPDYRTCIIKQSGDEHCTTHSENVSLSASPAPGWSFAGWSGACTGTGGCNVGMSVSRQVAASFSDKAAPSVSLSGPVQDSELRNSVSVGATASDNWAVSKVEFLLDGLPAATDSNGADGWSATVDLSGKPHRDHVTITARAWDPAENSRDDGRTYFIDRQVAAAFAPPTPEADSWVSAGSPQVAFTHDTDVVSRECRINDGVFADCGTTYTPPTAHDGAYKVDVKVVDELGNEEMTGRSFKVDRTAPAVSIATPAGGSFRNSGFTPAYTVTDAMTPSPTVTCAVDAGAFGACGPVALLPDGPHVFKVKARDAAGHQTVATSAFTVDTVAPDAQITGGPAQGSIIETPAATFTFTASDGSPLQQRECRLDGAPYAPCGSAGSHALSGLADGPHTFQLRATDAARNARERSRGFTVNAVRPSVAITSGPADGSAVAESAVTFGFSAAGAVEVSCSLDSATGFRPCSGADFDALSQLGDGTHVFRVRARDEADELVVAARTFNVDTSQPQTRIDAGLAEGSSTPASDVTFAFSASVDGATFRCRFGKPGSLGPFGPCSGPGNTHSAGGLAPGSYVFEVQAVNALGTPDASPEQRAFKLFKPLPPLQFTIANFWTIHSRARTGVKELTVKHLPAGARVDVRCKGPGCPFKRDTAKVVKGKAALKKLFGKRKLRAGAVIEIRVTATGVDGRAVRFKMRKNKFPKRVELCIPQSTGKLTRC